MLKRRNVRGILDALEVKVIFSEPTDFDPADYPRLKDMGQWHKDERHNIWTLDVKHFINYQEDELVHALSDARVDPYKYEIKSRSIDQKPTVTA